jgi:hypothetical protein
MICIDWSSAYLLWWFELWFAVWCCDVMCCDVIELWNDYVVWSWYFVHVFTCKFIIAVQRYENYQSIVFLSYCLYIFNYGIFCFALNCTFSIVLHQNHCLSIPSLIQSYHASSYIISTSYQHHHTNIIPTSFQYHIPFVHFNYWYWYCIIFHDIQPLGSLDLCSGSIYSLLSLNMLNYLAMIPT